ncbi:universal stress protein [Terriglobus sp. ADX1]|uniref:universal stress protein n=1 Tax=Terriglobus sp. ADX1 TaxID=2794063 RepID=UPI002FE63A51
MQSVGGSEQGVQKCGPIIACIDLSKSSKAVLQQAKLICLRIGSPLQILTVCEHGDPSGLMQDGAAMFTAEVERRKKQLELMTEGLQGPGFSVTPIVLTGDAIHAVLSFVEEVSPELLVMGTSGKRGIERFFLGSTAEAILRSASCPVLTLGPKSHPQLSGPIIFATDFNPCAEEDLRFALRVSSQMCVSLHCVHFLPPKVLKLKNTIVPDVLAEALRRLAADAGAKSGDTVCSIEPGFRIGRDIVEFARRSEASAIVLGVRRRTIATSHLPGHEIFKVLATATCPVYTLSHSKDQFVFAQPDSYVEAAVSPRTATSGVAQF